MTTNKQMNYWAMFFGFLIIFILVTGVISKTQEQLKESPNLSDGSAQDYRTLCTNTAKEAFSKWSPLFEQSIISEINSTTSEVRPTFVSSFKSNYNVNDNTCYIQYRTRMEVIKPSTKEKLSLVLMSAYKLNSSNDSPFKTSSVADFVGRVYDSGSLQTEVCEIIKELNSKTKEPPNTRMISQLTGIAPSNKNKCNSESEYNSIVENQFGIK